MTEFKTIPYFENQGEWSIPIEVLYHVWNEMEKSGNKERFFYDGQIKSFEDFLPYLRDKSKLFIFVTDEQRTKIWAFGVISDLNNQTAFAHFAFMNGFKKGVGEAVIDHWRNLRRKDDQSLVETLIGVTPESYGVVLKIIETWGFRVIGKIPRICLMHYENRKEAGIISYLDLKEN